MTDPLLRKSHAHPTPLSEPDVDEELDEYFRELDERLREQQEQVWAQLSEEDEQQETE